MAAPQFHNLHQEAVRRAKMASRKDYYKVGGNPYYKDYYYYKVGGNPYYKDYYYKVG
jgi:hypothetical protein